MRDTERKQQRQRQRGKQAPCREPDVGLDPGTPGSRPELKAGPQPLSHPGVPRVYFSDDPELTSWLLVRCAVRSWGACSPAEETDK